MDRNLSMGLDGRFKLVALRKESVDRNQVCTVAGRLLQQSLSARRAWIEIIGLTYDGLIASVALRKESVDRNNGRLGAVQNAQSRSPQGERG